MRGAGREGRKEGGKEGAAVPARPEPPPARPRRRPPRGLRGAAAPELPAAVSTDRGHGATRASPRDSQLGRGLWGQEGLRGCRGSPLCPHLTGEVSAPEFSGALPKHHFALNGERTLAGN